MCRNAYAPLFAPTVAIDQEHFYWLSGEDKLTAFESSLGKQRYFCSVCGSHLLAKRLAQSNSVRRTATLNNNPGYNPAMHIRRSIDVAWLQDDQNTVSYSERPPGR
jgi:ADP-ribosyl-[dinitrogen reductase] hydrolase